jgi:hypothetical protein
VNLNTYCGGRGIDCYMRLVAHPLTEDCMLQFIVHLRLSCSTILSSIGKWSNLPPTDWTFWGTFQNSGYLKRDLLF